jgi:gamma-glutamyltranspeptidase/glutathione hydrolase
MANCLKSRKKYMLYLNSRPFHSIIWLVCITILCSAHLAFGQEIERPAPEIATGFNYKGGETADKYIVVTSNEHATNAAYDILDKGGTAAEAAIAAQLVLGLTEPQSSGLGGGAFLLYYDAKNKKLISLDGREKAPQQAGPDLFIRPDGTSMNFHEAAIGGRSVGVPGIPALLEKMHHKFGSGNWDRLFEPAINLAQSGFEISPRLAKMIEADKGMLDRYAATRDYFYNHDGTLINLPYADTLKSFRDHGSAYFYDIHAPVNMAEDIVNIVRNAADNPGLLTIDDLADYTIIERDPVCDTYRGYKICSMGEPSSGGLTMLQILKILERFNLSSLDPNNADAIHLIAEASRLAFADRNRYMADSDFVETPGLSLLDDQYLVKRRNLINPDSTIRKIEPGIPPGWENKNESAPDNSRPGTSHISIIDMYGNILSMTTTIESAFGSKLMAGGFLLNNQLTDFSFLPEKGGRIIANRVEGDKRPRSSMTPTIIFDPEGQPFMIIGSAGGSRIIGYVVQRIIAVIDWNMEINNAISMPSFLARGSMLELESGLEHLKTPLEQSGNRISIREMNSGLTAITIKNKKYRGSADPRREGTAKGK